jgi:peroxiredoxin
MDQRRNFSSLKEPLAADLTGKSAPPFELRDSDGRIRHLSDFRGSWLLLVFHRHLG